MSYKKVVFIPLIVLSLFLSGCSLVNESEIIAPTADNISSTFEEQSVSGGAVTVSVTPKDLSSEAEAWEFEVVLSTHSVDLLQDMVKVSELRDNDGKVYPSSTWAGDPPGGHHLKGVLTFSEIPKNTESITLIIKEVGGIEEREFKWNLNI